MNPPTPSRRDFLQRSSAGALGAWLALGATGCREAARSASESTASGDDARRVLTDEEWRTLDAIADRIIPPDGDAPGARAAGAATFMDHYADRQPDVLAGLRGILPTLPAGVADMEPSRVDDVLHELERSDPGSMGMLTFLTVVGTFGVPERGGNRDQVGWKMIGFDPRHAWQPPFGYYDAEAARVADAGTGGEA